LHSRDRQRQRPQSHGFPRSGLLSNSGHPLGPFFGWSNWFDLHVTDVIKTVYYVDGSLIPLTVVVCGRMLR